MEGSFVLLVFVSVCVLNSFFKKNPYKTAFPPAKNNFIYSLFLDLQFDSTCILQ